MRIIEVRGPYYFCKSVYQFSMLTKKGIFPINTVPNAYRDNRLVWVYEKTPELQKALNQIASEDTAFDLCL